VRVDVGDGRDDDARRLDDVDGLDADARQTWTEAGATFLGMWTVMMVGDDAAVPRADARAVSRRGQESGEGPLGRLTAIVGAGYYAVWTAIGIAAFPLGVALASIEMREAAIARAVPFAVGLIVLSAGLLQLTKWKAHGLACCREAQGCGRASRADARTAWRHGIELGIRCARSCGNLMALLLVLGVMDLWAMAVVTAAVTVERVAPAGERIARVTGAVVSASGMLMIARAAGLG
jgi:predicted metal-binding membrane protein